jgi:hypothetical protein
MCSSQYTGSYHGAIADSYDGHFNHFRILIQNHNIQHIDYGWVNISLYRSPNPKTANVGFDFQNAAVVPRPTNGVTPLPTFRIYCIHSWKSKFNTFITQATTK